MIEPVEQNQDQSQDQGQGQPQGQKRSALIAVAVLAVVVALALAGYGAISSAQPASSSAASPYAVAQSGPAAAADAESDAEAQQALACELVTFQGEDVTIGQISGGKPLVVNVWATWCPYCVAEMQDYQRLYEAYGDKVQFVMLNACDSSREVSLAREYVSGNGFTFPVYYDAEHQAQRLFGISALPTTIILSDSGRTLLSRPGQISYDSMDATLASLVGA